MYALFPEETKGQRCNIIKKSNGKLKDSTGAGRPSHPSRLPTVEEPLDPFVLSEKTKHQGREV